MVAPALPEGWEFEGARVDGASITARYVHRADRAVAAMTLAHPASATSKMATVQFMVSWRVSPSARDAGALVRAVVASVRATEADFVWSRRDPVADPADPPQPARRTSEDTKTVSVGPDAGEGDAGGPEPSESELAAEAALAVLEAVPADALVAGAQLAEGHHLAAVSADELGTVEVEFARADGVRLSVRLNPKRRRVVARSAREGADGPDQNWEELATSARWFVTVGRLFPHLHGGAEGEGGGGGAEAQRDAIVLDPVGVAEFLAPEVTIDGATIAGHRLVAVRSFLPSRSAASPFGRVLLEFAPEDSRETVEVVLAPTDAGESNFGSHAGLGVGLLNLGLADRAGAKTRAALLCSQFLALLARKLDPRGRIVVPARTGDVRLLGDGRRGGDGPGEGAPPNLEVLNLNLDAECGQQCTFCPIKSFVPAHDGGAAELQSVELQLREARARGQVRARLNGIDPLMFSRVLDLAAAVRAAGFERLEVMGPGRRFADDDFRREFLRRGPDHTEVIVPLYGVTAEVHDRVTGAPGSHAEVLRAIDGLLADLGPRRLGLATVITRQNVDEIAALARFARERALPLWPQLPYPLRQTRYGAYTDSALPETEIVERVLRSLDGAAPEDRATCLRALATAVRHPCVLWRAQKATGIGAFEASRGLARRALAGVAVTDEHNPRKGGAARSLSTLHVVSAGCAEAPRCALAPACAAEHYAAYVELFGEAEFRAVGVWDLM